MIKIGRLFSIIIIFCFSRSFSQIQKFEWAKSFGSIAGDHAESICTDLQGNVLSTGIFSGTVDFDPGVGVYTLTALGQSDCFVVKLNSKGDFVWALSFGSASGSATVARDIVTDKSGNVYVGGDFGGVVDFAPGASTFTLAAQASPADFCAKYTSAGSLVWAKQFGGGAGSWVHMSLDPSGANLFIASTFGGTRDFDPGSSTFVMTAQGFSDGYILRLTNNGTFVWAKQIGAPSGDVISTIICSSTSGDLLLGGSFGGGTDFDPGPATFTLSSTGGMCICKLSNAGNFIWAKGFTGTGYAQIYGMDLDGTDNIYFTGSFQSTIDMDPGPGQLLLSANSTGSDSYIGKLSSTGNFVFAKHYSVTANTNSAEGRDLATDHVGAFYTSGHFNATTDFDFGPGTFTMTPVGSAQSVYLAKYDLGGNFFWAKQISSNNPIATRTIFLDHTSNIYLASSYYNNADFDPDAGTYSLSSNGGPDAYMLKLSLCNDIPYNSGSYYVCAGKSATLSASSGGSITWHSTLTSTITIATGSTFIVQSPAPGSYTYYAASSTCTDVGTRNPVTFSVATLPPVSITSTPAVLCRGASAVLSASGTDDFLWWNSSAASSVVVSPTITTNYSIIITSGLTGCANQGSYTLTVTDCTNLSEPFLHKEELVYPNPASDRLFIEIDFVGLAELYSSAGQKIRSYQIDENLNSIELRELETGIYFLIIQTADRSTTRKIIVSK